MGKEGKNLETRETGPADLKLNWFDLRAGHWPDSKSPPWGLNTFGAIQKKWPEISEILKQAEQEMKPGEEKVFWSGEMEFPDGRMEQIEIKIWKREFRSGQTSVDLWIWPKANKYYKKKE
jgi:hypothetical protein